MKILNKDFKEKMIDFVNENMIGLNEHECECYSNMLYVLNDVTDNQFTFDELINTYDFFTDIVDGKRPDIDMFERKDAFKGFFRLSKRYSTTKNLTDEQRKLFCFVIYQASCIMVMDEKTGKTIWNFGMFENGTKALIKEYEYELKKFPSKFEIISYSDSTKDDYGLTPENPIEVTSVSMEYSYLSGIQRIDGKKISYERIGSFSNEKYPDIFVDGYEIYVKKLVGKKKIAELYITGNGTENSQCTPKGFKFI